MPAVSSCRSPSSFTCLPHEGGTTHLLLSRPYSGFATDPFNLTNGETMIRDEEGIEASSIQAAVIPAMEAVEELRAQDPSNSEEWQGWWLEIVDASGQAVQTIPLDVLSAH
jgi:hypothetical protein